MGPLFPSRATVFFDVAISLEHQILEILLKYQNVLPMEDAGAPFANNLRTREFHLEKVRGYVQRNQKIQIVLPAFPAKSPNPKKTSGFLPDLGEVRGLQRLDGLCQDIARIYPPGAELIICSDGRVFSDLVEVSDANVNAYGFEITSIIQDYGLDNLSTFNLEDVFTDFENFDQMREKLTVDYARPLDEIRAQVKTDLGFAALFNGIHRFMFEDQMVLRPEISKNQNRLRAKDLAYAVIQRSNAWSELVEEFFESAVRFSIHPQPLHSQKIGIQLVHSEDRWRTPWHSVTLFDGMTYRLVSREAAEAMNAVPKKENGKYLFYEI